MTSSTAPGRARRRRPTPVQLVSGLGVTVFLLAVTPLALIANRYASVEKARALEVSGRPCQALSPAAYAASGAPTLQTTNVEGVLFARQYGYVDCDFIATDHGRGLETTPVCRFNNPTLLAVTTPHGRFYFDTGVSPATITLARGEPRCVLKAARGTSQ